MPPPELKSNAQRTQAQKHWRDCQGKGLPVATKEQRAKARTAAGVAGCRNRWQRHKLNADQKSERDATNFEKWLKTIPKKAAKAACKPNFEHPLRASGNGSLMCQCEECQSEKTVPKFRGVPCSKRPPGMLVSDWQLLALKRSPALEKKLSGKNRKHDEAYRKRRLGTEAGEKAKAAKAAKQKAWYWAMSERDRKRYLAENLARQKKAAKKKQREAAKKQKRI